MFDNNLLAAKLNLDQKQANTPGEPTPTPPVKKLSVKNTINKYDAGVEMGRSGKSIMPYDNKPTTEIVKTAAAKIGVNPSLLMSSAWVEGMNKAVLTPDDVSEAYASNESNLNGFPVDGFFNYGLDRFGDNYSNLKKYLPVGFETRFKTFAATNEKNESINTAAFKTNEDALIAKGAMLRESQDNVANYAKKMGLVLNDDEKDYFTLAAYNGGMSNAKKMLDEYSTSKNKKNFISGEETTRKGVHKNIISRLNNRKIANDLLR